MPSCGDASTDEGGVKICGELIETCPGAFPASDEDADERESEDGHDAKDGFRC